jgi:hypothetical protein
MGKQVRNANEPAASDFEKQCFERRCMKQAALNLIGAESLAK